MHEIERILKITASLFAVVVPCILLAGYCYHLGYISSFGLNTDLVTKSMSEMLVESMIFDFSG